MSESKNVNQKEAVNKEWNILLKKCFELTET